jgi:hypothetical protein
VKKKSCVLPKVLPLLFITRANVIVHPLSLSRYTRRGLHAHSSFSLPEVRPVRGRCKRAAMPSLSDEVLWKRHPFFAGIMGRNRDYGIESCSNMGKPFERAFYDTGYRNPWTCPGLWPDILCFESFGYDDTPCHASNLEWVGYRTASPAKPRHRTYRKAAGCEGEQATSH